MLRNVRAMSDAMINGKVVVAHWRKSCGLVSVAGSWVDFSMTSGNPPGNYYASVPLVAERLDPWSGIYAGPAQSPAEKYLVDLMLCTPSSGLLGAWKLCDYLLYYPFIDLDDTDVQAMNNTKTIDRYTDGLGVHAVLIAQSPTTGGGTFNFTYINQDGAEKTSPTQVCSSSSTNYGTAINSLAATTAGGPWLKLAVNDSGIRRITSFTNLTANGGLAALVLVKPLATIVISEINAPVEVSFGLNTPILPRVYDNAFLGFLAGVNASVAAGLLTGRANIIWT
jgi:hypothetical protein